MHRCHQPAAPWGEYIASRAGSWRATPDAYHAAGWGDWRAEVAARALYDRLSADLGDAAGRSPTGFAAPALAVTANLGNNEPIQLSLTDSARE